MRLFLDVETYSTVDLKKSNVYAYTEDPMFEILMCAWSLEGDPVHLAVGEKEIRKIPYLWDDAVEKVAHNAGFERVVFSRLAGLPVGEYLPPEQWLDTAALAAVCGLPRKLGDLTKTLGVEEKDSAGTRLISLFCTPYKGRRVMPRERPEQWEELCAYNVQDVVALLDVFDHLPDFPAAERQVWNADQRINDRGMRVDLPIAQKAVVAAKQNNDAMGARVIKITGVSNPNSTQQIRAWLAGQGVRLPNLQSLTIERELRKGHPENVLEVLSLRRELALVASRKYEAALRGVSEDGRLRGQFVYHGAHTGRWSSVGTQLHNLPRQADPREAMGLFDLRNDFGASPSMLKSLVRPMFLGPFVISDFSAVEARVLAWLAGEQWVLDAFTEGRDIYEETAARMGGMTRQQGKVAVLAGGYGGAVGSMRAMGYGGQRCERDRILATRNKDTKTGEPSRHDIRSGEVGRALVQEARRENPDHKCDDEIRAIVDAWRDANARIVAFWGRLERGFYDGTDVGRIGITKTRAGDRVMHLPSGRDITYHKVRYERRMVESNTGEMESRRVITYRHVRGYREVTYGGRLTENCLAAGTLVLTEQGWTPIEQCAGLRVWDGVEWVNHSGVSHNGAQPTIRVSGVTMTGDHRVLTTEGWSNASSCQGLDRTEVRLPDSTSLPRQPQQQVAMAGAVPMRGREGTGVFRVAQAEVMRVSDRRTYLAGAALTRDDQAPGLRSVALDARAVREDVPSGVSELRGTRHHGVRTVARLQPVLAGHGSDVPSRTDDRAQGQQRAVLSRELLLGDDEGQQPKQADNSSLPNLVGPVDSWGDQRADRALREHSVVQGVERRSRRSLTVSAGRTTEVYDLVNCGSRSRFVVLSETGPMIVHNCTQAVARDLLAHAMVLLDQDGYPIVAHVHDEVVVETDNADAVKRRMTTTPTWASDLPLDASCDLVDRYTK